MAFLFLGDAYTQAEPVAFRPPTICNPVDLDYRFELRENNNTNPPSHRTAADPSAIFFRGEYWLFASRSGGYWHSPDFLHWTLVEPTGLSLEAWAPTVEAINGKLYFSAQGAGLYTTDDPAKGVWTLASKGLDTGHDGAVFRDDDGRVYLYTGCSNKDPIRGVELDVKHDFKPLGPLKDLISFDPLQRGWEARHSVSEPSDPVADAANKKLAPWMEGAWMNKVNGRYYLQYAAPGTQFETYGDGVFVSDHPLGPFTYQPYSPVSFKPTGFVRGAGHSSTFKDVRGNYWHITTIALSKRHVFERRLGVYPARFFPDGQMACNTYLGDYPQYAPGVSKDPFNSNSPGWMLLSLNKPVKASSELPDHPASLAVDENLADWWSAATGNSDEWLQVDLGGIVRIEALQMNFADEGATQYGRLRNDAYRYLVEVSDDGAPWKPLLDRRGNTRDAPHEYVQLAAPVMGRYVRITNLHSPAGAKFSLSGLRVFGSALGTLPEAVKEISVKRDPSDARSVHVAWSPTKGADFYIVRYGVKPDRLYSNYQIYEGNKIDINSLNANVPYYVTVDAINGSGITTGPVPVSIPVDGLEKRR